MFGPNNASAGSLSPWNAINAEDTRKYRNTYYGVCVRVLAHGSTDNLLRKVWLAMQRYGGNV